MASNGTEQNSRSHLIAERESECSECSECSDVLLRWKSFLPFASQLLKMTNALFRCWSNRSATVAPNWLFPPGKSLTNGTRPTETSELCRAGNFRSKLLLVPCKNHATSADFATVGPRTRLGWFNYTNCDRLHFLSTGLIPSKEGIGIILETQKQNTHSSIWWLIKNTHYNRAIVGAHQRVLEYSNNKIKAQV